jgi:hypothetical protein
MTMFFLWGYYKIILKFCDASHMAQEIVQYVAIHETRITQKAESFLFYFYKFERLLAARDAFLLLNVLQHCSAKGLSVHVDI